MYSAPVSALNSTNPDKRAAALNSLGSFIAEGKIKRKPNNEVNNHVHTFFSFSPYSPSGAAFASWQAGLKAAGIIDHDTIAGAVEFTHACSLCGIASTVGFETRVNFFTTPFERYRLNNPDSRGIAYITIQGIAEKHFSETADFLKPVQTARQKRSEKETARLNTLLQQLSCKKIDFEKDVYDASMAAHGGTITERHILAALSRNLIETLGQGRRIVDFLKQKLHAAVPDKIQTYLLDPDNPHYLYDLLGILKAALTDDFFIQPTADECLPVQEVVDFARSIDAIPAYSYLGDVQTSTTGDKAPQQFEDSYLDELFPFLQSAGFRAVTFMPPRNTEKQLQRIMQLCRDWNFMQISGVDINSSRQSFNCPEIETPQFSHLTEATWALIAHEKISNYIDHFSLFGTTGSVQNLSLGKRIQFFSRLGQQLDTKPPYINITVREKLDE